uniref:Uncharacterized protein n=1 Tax=Oryza glaberrima TaxID=4538 RepID=I1PB14_ORYGL
MANWRSNGVPFGLTHHANHSTTAQCMTALPTRCLPRRATCQPAPPAGAHWAIPLRRDRQTRPWSSLHDDEELIRFTTSQKLGFSASPDSQQLLLRILSSPNMSSAKFPPNVAGKTCIANFDECWTTCPCLTLQWPALSLQVASSWDSAM